MERVATRLSIGDGFRFGIGLMLAAVFPWLLISGIGLAAATWLPDVLPRSTSANANEKPAESGIQKALEQLRQLDDARSPKKDDTRR